MKSLQLVIYLTITLLLSGCGGSTALRFRNIDEDKVVKALSNRGLWADPNETDKEEIVTKSHYYGFGQTDFTKKTLRVKEKGEKKAVIERRSDGFLKTYFTRKTVRVKKEGADAIRVSLRCSERNVGLLDLPDILFPVYHRDVKTERCRLLALVRELQKNREVAVEAAGKWKPPNEPQEIIEKNTMWIAFRGASVRTLISYLRAHGYEKSSASTETEMIFEREETIKPDIMGPARFQSSVVQVNMKVIEEDTDQVIAIGVAAISMWRHASIFGPDGPYKDDSEKMCYSWVEGICLELATSTNRLEFIAPSPWAEEIRLNRTTQFIVEGFKQIEKEKERRKAEEAKRNRSTTRKIFDALFK